MVVVVVVVVNPTLQGRVEVRVRVTEGVMMVAMRSKPPQRIAVTKMIQKLMPPQRMDVMVLK